MYWGFTGEKVTIEIGRDGETVLHLEADWHQPIPDMGGPVPELSVDQVRAVFGRPLRVRLRAGGPERIIRDAAELALVAAGDRLAGISHEPRCMITSFPDISPDVRVSAVYEPAGFTALTSAILAFAASASPKFFEGGISGTMIAGPEPMRATAAETESFLRGERPVMLAKPPTLAFGFGSAMPEAPDFRSVLKELKDQF